MKYHLMFFPSEKNLLHRWKRNNSFASFNELFFQLHPSNNQFLVLQINFIIRCTYFTTYEQMYRRLKYNRKNNKLEHCILPSFINRYQYLLFLVYRIGNPFFTQQLHFLFATFVSYDDLHICLLSKTLSSIPC